MNEAKPKIFDFCFYWDQQLIELNMKQISKKFVKKMLKDSDKLFEKKFKEQTSFAQEIGLKFKQKMILK